MPPKLGTILCILPLAVLLMAAAEPPSQNGSAGDVRGTVSDPTGAVIPGAMVHLVSAVTGMDRTVFSDPAGQFDFSNVPLHPYQIKVAANGFAPLNQAIDLRSAIGINLKLVLQIATADSTVTVEAGGTWSRTIPRFTPTWIASSSTSCPSRASLRD